MRNKTTPPRFRLLPYQTIAKSWLGPALWLIPGGFLLWWVVPNQPQFDSRYAFVGLIVAGASMLIALYGFLARRAHISCHKNNFVIHTPLYPVAFSYQRITIVRPVDFKSIFPPQDERNARRRFYKDIWGKTVVVISLKGYPIPAWWMRVWIHPYLIHPKETAVVLPVEDWMRLSRSIETLRDAWRETQRAQREW
jgi:hypothetical protein